MNLPRRTINTVDYKSKNTWFGMAAILLVVAGFMIYQNRDSNVTLTNENMTIHGLYSAEISYAEISEVNLVQSLPIIKLRTNGYSFLNYAKGYFRLADVGKAELFVNLKTPPFIHVKTKDGKVFYLNFSDPQKTQDLYSKLKTKLAGNN
ncbi:MAG: hypothetical protein IH595_11610 [Bacteroidales bacterium]|nr:hypothetical protein [Bacteroidales bacterium]